MCKVCSCFGGSDKKHELALKREKAKKEVEMNKFLDRPENNVNNNSFKVKALYATGDAILQEGDLSFIKGEIMEVLQEHDTWYFVRSELSGKEGLVPSNFVTSLAHHSWDHGKISRLDSEVLLTHENNSDRDFLVRFSETYNDDKTFTLSIRDSKKLRGCSHHMIRLDREGKLSVEEGKSFLTLPQLVKYYQSNNTLAKPCYRGRRLIDDLHKVFSEKWILNMADISKEEIIGKGKDGIVFRGTWKQSPVALKTLNDKKLVKDLFREGTSLLHCRHKNIVRLHGMSHCLIRDEVLLVQEYMPLGSVLDLFVKLKRRVSYARRQFMALEVARGMMYLETHNYIHRDLAARNVLLSGQGDNLVCKIADFGMARSLTSGIYVKQELIPVRWCAPEIFRMHEFSIKSDIWAYGVFLMELFTNCESPYQKFGSNFEVMQNVLNGYRIPKPQSHKMNQADYNMIRSCWQVHPKARPTFRSIVGYFENENLTDET